MYPPSPLNCQSLTDFKKRLHTHLWFVFLSTRVATSTTKGCPSFAWVCRTRALKGSSLPGTHQSKASPSLCRNEWLATPIRSGDLPPMEPSQQRWAEGVGVFCYKWEGEGRAGEPSAFPCAVHTYTPKHPHAYMGTSMSTCMHACIHRCTHTHTCTCAHTCTYTHTGTYAHAHTHAHTHTRTGTYAHAHTHTHTHMYARTCMHVCVHVYAHTHTHTHTHTNTHTHTHTHTHLLSSSLPALQYFNSVFNFCNKFGLHWQKSIRPKFQRV